MLRISRDGRSAYRCHYHVANCTRFKKPLFNCEKSVKKVEDAFLHAAESLGVVVEAITVRNSLVSLKMVIDPSESPSQAFAKVKYSASKSLRGSMQELPDMIFARTFMVTTCGKDEDGLDILEYSDDVKIKYKDQHRRFN